jgi:DNA-binding CsgD family transcriptional regulator
MPLFVIGTYRRDETPPGANLRDWRARLLTQRLAGQWDLEPLTIAQTGTVVTLLLATGLPAPRDVVEAVHERTDGVPLHIEELIGAIDPALRSDVGVIRTASVPETIEDAVLARLARRTPEAQAAARAGAVLGRCFVPEVLAGIMNLRPEALDAPLQELVDHAVLEGPAASGMFDFRHQLLRDVLYRSTPDRDRRRFHALAGEFGAELEGASEVHASLHYECAGLRDQAYASALEGARQAARLRAHREAFELYRRAVANAPADLRPPDRGGLFKAYADEAAAIEQLEIGLDAALEAERVYRDAGHLVGAVSAMDTIAGIWRRQGRPVMERLAYARRLVDEIDAAPAGSDVGGARGNAQLRLAIAAIDASRLDDARSAIAAARVAGAATGDQAVPLIADWLGGYVAVLGGDLPGGLRAIERSAQDQEVGGFEDSVSAYRDGAELAIRYLQYGQAARFIDAGMRYADSVQQSHCRHVMAAGQAIVDWSAGAWETALVHGEQAMADHGCARATNIARWPVGYIAMARGDALRARSVLQAAEAFGREGGAVDFELPATWGLAELALLEGDAAAAVDRCEEAFSRADAVDQPVLIVPFVVTGVRAYEAAGRPEDASRWAGLCAARLAGLGAVGQPAIDHARGLVAISAGSVGLARRSLEGALRGWTHLGRLWEAEACRLDLATALARSNRFAAAVALASEVRERASRLGIPALVARADGIVRHARDHVVEEAPWRPLTAREFEVARLITEGRTNAEIADSLGIAPKTASSHVEHILAKLGASRRAEIAAWASQIAPTAVAR